MIEILKEKLNTSGWIIEASDKLGWVLRKEKAPIIKDINVIKNVLNIDDLNERIELNPEFNVDDKASYLYTHSYGSNGQHIFSNKEILFGKQCENGFDNLASCNRVCKTE